MAELQARRRRRQRSGDRYNVGAIGGAVVASVAEEKATRAQGLELTIKMDSGKILSIVQEVDDIQPISKGQRVRVPNARRARVSPE